MKSLILILMTLSLISCGKEAKKTETHLEQNISPELKRYILENQSFSCPDQDGCPEGIARVFTINFEDNNKSSICTGFLVAEDQVLTNAHCAWAGKVSLEKTCEGMFFSFPESEGRSHDANCSEIVYRDPKQRGQHFSNPGDNDFALIKLDRKIPVNPFKLLRNALRPGVKVYPIVMDQIDGVHARIVRLECSVEEVDPYGVVTLKNCPAISGNSGSPILDESSKIVGIINASSDPAIRKSTDSLELRRTSETKAFGYTVDQILSVLRLL